MAKEPPNVSLENQIKRAGYENSQEIAEFVNMARYVPVLVESMNIVKNIKTSDLTSEDKKAKIIDQLKENVKKLHDVTYFEPFLNYRNNIKLLIDYLTIYNGKEDKISNLVDGYNQAINVIEENRDPLPNTSENALQLIQKLVSTSISDKVEHPEIAEFLNGLDFLVSKDALVNLFNHEQTQDIFNNFNKQIYETDIKDLRDSMHEYFKIWRLKQFKIAPLENIQVKLELSALQEVKKFTNLYEKTVKLGQKATSFLKTINISVTEAAKRRAERKKGNIEETSPKEKVDKILNDIKDDITIFNEKKNLEMENIDPEDIIEELRKRKDEILKIQIDVNRALDIISTDPELQAFQIYKEELDPLKSHMDILMQTISNNIISVSKQLDRMNMCTSTSIFKMPYNPSDEAAVKYKGDDKYNNILNYTFQDITDETNKNVIEIVNNVINDLTKDFNGLDVKNNEELKENISSILNYFSKNTNTSNKSNLLAILILVSIHKSLQSTDYKDIISDIIPYLQYTELWNQTIKEDSLESSTFFQDLKSLVDKIVQPSKEENPPAAATEAAEEEAPEQREAATEEEAPPPKQSRGSENKKELLKNILLRLFEITYRNILIFLQEKQKQEDKSELLPSYFGYKVVPRFFLPNSLVKLDTKNVDVKTLLATYNENVSNNFRLDDYNIMLVIFRELTRVILKIMESNSKKDFFTVHLKKIHQFCISVQKQEYDNTLGELLPKDLIVMAHELQPKIKKVICSPSATQMISKANKAITGANKAITGATATITPETIETITPETITPETIETIETIEKSAEQVKTSIISKENEYNAQIQDKKKK